MELRRCDKGHFYDVKKYYACPYCDNFLANRFFEKEITDNNRWDYLKQIKDKLLKINHENIVKIYNLYSLNGSNYIKEEFVYGETVENMIKNKKISLEIFLDIGISMCKVLKYLNECDLVYMDVKPSNIIYNKLHKKVILIDIESICYKNISFKSKYYGTIEYSSPEQIIISKYSIQGSVYSLGLVFYKMLTGSLPFNVSKSGMLKKALDGLSLEFNLCCDFKNKLEIIDLIRNMVCINENERLDVETIIKALDSIKSEANIEELQQIIISKEGKFEYDKISNTAFDDNVTCDFYNDLFVVPETNVLENITFWGNSANDRDLTYRMELLKEYNSILVQTKVLFWCWISAVWMCYVIAGFCLYLILEKRFIDSACSLVLEGLVYAVQKIFSIREDHYRDLINNKIEHLQKGDSIEYAISKAEVINDISEKDKKIMEIIDDIRKMCN